MARKTHAQHLARIAEKQRKERLANRLFAGFVVSPHTYAYLVRNIDRIARLSEDTRR